MQIDVVVVAAGKSLRMGQDKLFLPVGEEPLIFRTLSVFAARPEVARLVVVLGKENADWQGVIKTQFPDAPLLFARGGDTRTQSVLNGLALCGSDLVAVHDGARPFLSPALWEQLLACAKTYGSAVPVLPVHDSVRVFDNDRLVGNAERDRLRAVQTPQIFARLPLTEALRLHPDTTDESAAMLAENHPVHTVNGDNRNTKVTDMGTYFGINAKIGTGFDLHRLAIGRTLVIGGVTLDYEKGAVAHSDGDVLCHALIDALLSAAGQRDIGVHYPDNDQRYRDIDSTLLLSDVMAYYRAHNLKVHNVSATVFLERPKLKDFIPLMQIKLARLMDVDPRQVAIAAKTGEGLGDIGNGDAVAASVTLTVI